MFQILSRAIDKQTPNALVTRPPLRAHSSNWSAKPKRMLQLRRSMAADERYAHGPQR